MELDIELIGSQSPLTKAEENLISEYFSKRKKKATISRSSKKPTVRRGAKISV